MRDGKARVLNPQEFQRLIAVIGETTHPERNIAMLYLSYGCGLRVGEICSVNLGDVLNINGSIKKTFTLKRKNTKTKKAREVYLENEKVVNALKEYVTELRTQGDVHLDGPLFRSQKGKRFSPNVLQMRFATFYKAAGLEGCKSHSGRRTFATRLITNGADIKSVSMLMGHSAISQTAEYVESSPAILKRVASKAM